MRRAIIFCGAVSFAMAFLGSALAVSLTVAPRVTADGSRQPEEIRASAFILEGPDGTVLARLQPGRTGGALQLFDTAGTERLFVAGSGQVVVLDANGRTPVLRAGRTFVDTPVGGPLDGLELIDGSSISHVSPSR